MLSLLETLEEQVSRKDFENACLEAEEFFRSEADRHRERYPESYRERKTREKIQKLSRLAASTEFIPEREAALKRIEKLKGGGGEKARKS